MQHLKTNIKQILFDDMSDTSDINKKCESSELENYIKITRDNLDDFELGMHIKYIKNINGTDHIMNGGFLLDILCPDKIVQMRLVLKTNIIWRLCFLKYDIYGKKTTNFDKGFAKLYKCFKTDIAESVNEKKKAQDYKIAKIKANKNYFVNI